MPKLEQLHVNVSIVTDPMGRPINNGQNFTATVTNTGLILSTGRRPRTCALAPEVPTLSAGVGLAGGVRRIDDRGASGLDGLRVLTGRRDPVGIFPISESDVCSGGWWLRPDSSMLPCR